ncbi:MAG: hypothetical protein ABFS56_07025 [Pseudomonadota bacterium]
MTNGYFHLISGTCVYVPTARMSRFWAARDGIEAVRGMRPTTQCH